MKAEDGTGGRHPLLGDVDCHPPISFKCLAGNFGCQLFYLSAKLTSHWTIMPATELLQTKELIF